MIFFLYFSVNLSIFFIKIHIIYPVNLVNPVLLLHINQANDESFWFLIIIHITIGIPSNAVTEFIGRVVS